MKAYLALTVLFLRDLVRRRMLWFLVVVGAGTLAFNYFLAREVGSLVEAGRSYDLAVSQASAVFHQFTRTLLPKIMLVAAALAVMVAPESRRNGTTQFVLSVPLRRRSLALSQFSAIAVFVILSVLIAHVGIAFGGWRIGAVSGEQAALSWLGLLVPVLAVVAVVFALSLVFSVPATLLVFAGVPLLLGVLKSGIQQTGLLKFPLVVRILEQATFLFPRPENLVVWPRMPTEMFHLGPPVPDWRLLAAHEICALLFWFVLGAWLYRRHNFGSRTALK